MLEMSQFLVIINYNYTNKTLISKYQIQVIITIADQLIIKNEFG